MTHQLSRRRWVPAASDELVQHHASQTAKELPHERHARLEQLITDNAEIHDQLCVNLNPATNTMSPAAAGALSSGIGTRTSLGYPGAKYEMGLEAIEEIETTTAQLAAQLFGADYVEFRVPSGAMANLMVFMATAKAGDSIIVPPSSIAGHVTHHEPGAAGLFGLEIHEAPIDAERYTIDVDGLAALAARVRPRLITLGSSLNLHHHDVAGVRRIADDVGATVMFDAAHLSGVIAGGAWPNPLDEGAHVMTMSTYKSLAGPTAGLVLTSDAALAERIDAIAFPGLTANFDVGKTAALAFTLNDWLAHGEDYAREMTASAAALAAELTDAGVAVHSAAGIATRSHAFALDTRTTGGGSATAIRLRERNLLTSAIGLPTGADAGLRVGVNEMVRWGATTEHMAELAHLCCRALSEEPADAVATDVTAFRRRFDRVRFTV